MTRKRIDEKYYEETDFSSELLGAAGRRVVGASVKRITMNISEEIYGEAKSLDRFMNMGYQNVLKAAMAIGLSQLHKTLAEKQQLPPILSKTS